MFIKKVADFISGIRCPSDTLVDKVSFFLVFVLMGAGVIFIVFSLFAITWWHWRVMLPIEITLFVLWKLWSKWWDGE